MTRIQPRVIRIRPGEPGHGDNRSILRLRPVLIINGEPVDGWTAQWEIICPACGDDSGLDYRTVSPYLQKVRGPYPAEAEGQAALRRHRGLPIKTPTAAGAQGRSPATPAATPDLTSGIAAAQP
ncbi:MAG TPA: hypothetical protein VGM14_14660 [Streptosporangiaceae bacterium]